MEEASLHHFLQLPVEICGFRCNLEANTKIIILMLQALRLKDFFSNNKIPGL